MKAWRKHNMQQSRALKNAKEEIAYTPEDIAAKEAKIKQIKFFFLRSKHERRTHFQSEVKAPSVVLWNLLERVGIVQSA